MGFAKSSNNQDLKHTPGPNLASLLNRTFKQSELVCDVGECRDQEWEWDQNCQTSLKGLVLIVVLRQPGSQASKIYSQNEILESMSLKIQVDKDGKLVISPSPPLLVSW